MCSDDVVVSVSRGDVDAVRVSKITEPVGLSSSEGMWRVGYDPVYMSSAAAARKHRDDILADLVDACALVEAVERFERDEEARDLARIGGLGEWDEIPADVQEALRRIASFTGAPWV